MYLMTCSLDLAMGNELILELGKKITCQINHTSLSLTCTFKNIMSNERRPPQVQSSRPVRVHPVPALPIISRDSSDVAALKQRVAVLERLVAEGDRPKKRSSVTIDHADYKLRVSSVHNISNLLIRITDRFKQRLIRKHYEANFANDPNLCFDLNKFVFEKPNKKVVKALQDYIANISSDEREPDWTPEFVYQKCRSYLNGLRSKAKKSPEDLQNESRTNATRQKRDRKCQARLNAFRANEGLTTSFPGAGKLLDKRLMSDEEDVKDEDGFVVKTKVLRPNWRSPQANAFLDELSKLAEKDKLTQQKKRVKVVRIPKEYVLVDQHVDAELLEELPDEAKRQ
ncbi:uncharacterized protein BYT42DRAFT_217253 [Radiomyces spectabilis]|uniref:uncharacterized protein n=1 Tax=Radiomyces spectabilis TaxID=64574 RepID=UPI00221EAD49|nr:uncharacterized protein BYT42DRAFT_217253 [Radiomyces spectabilis]KAI8388001.1 hypothetical protein BYT42DRAFT_217253 [Radiomyces spectabilis]